MLRDVVRQLIGEVSGRSVGPIFKGAIGCAETSVGCITSQMTDGSKYSAAEA